MSYRPRKQSARQKELMIRAGRRHTKDPPGVSSPSGRKWVNLSINLLQEVLDSGKHWSSYGSFCGNLLIHPSY